MIVSEDNSIENLTKIQQWLLETMRVSILVKHYPSGSFSFVVMTHNGDATGWTRISPFIGKNYYNYPDALEAGINWYYHEKDKVDEEVVQKTKLEF